MRGVIVKIRNGKENVLHYSEEMKLCRSICSKGLKNDKLVSIPLIESRSQPISHSVIVTRNSQKMFIGDCKILMSRAPIVSIVWYRENVSIETFIL